MTSEQPDPRTLESWGDAFQYPIPVVRRLEIQIRGDIAANKEKLRTLVGASYRELLGTAETIVQMDERIHEVESKLITVGRNCNSRTLERRSETFAHLQHGLAARDRQHHPLASQLALLHNCSRAISQLLRSRGSILLAAKILVISKLVHKSLSSRKNVPPFLETLRDRLASQRLTLLRHVDRQLASPQASPETLTEAMCAFCLATSSSSLDALHNFLDVQRKGIRNMVQARQEISCNALKSLNIFIRTHQVTRALFPRRLAEALAAFRSHPLMAHPDILLLEQLDLEIHGCWVEDEVRNFTPWIKAESIPKPELDQIMDEWGTNTFSVFVKGLTTNLKAITEFSQLVVIRKSLLDAWLPAHNSLASSSHDVLDGLRDVIIEQLLGQIQRQAERLDLVGARISSALDSWRTSDDGSPWSLWDESLINMDFSSGGASFKREIMNRSRGGDLNILRILKPYHDYLSTIRSTESSIRELRMAHWDDSFDDEGEEFSAETITSVLNEDDPNILEQMLQAGLRTSFQSLQSSILSALRKVPAREGGDRLGVLIRVIREIRNSMPTSVSKADFCADSIDEIHRLLAEEVCRGISDPFKESVEKSLKRRHVAGRSLWEGEPPFPIQPSPPTFNLLKQMVRSMSDHGTDLWSPSAVAMLKISTAADVSRTLRALIKEHAGNQPVNGLKSKVDEVVVQEAGSGETGELTNGSSTTNRGDGRPQSSEKFREANLQLLFDAYYLQAALGVLDLPRENEEGLEGIILELNKDLRMEGSSIDRLRERGAEYWRRTNLLFRLLLPKGL